MILKRVVFKKRLHFYAVGAAFESLAGPAEVIGPWVKVRVPLGAGGFVECLVWGEDIWPAEIELPPVAMPVPTSSQKRNPITDVLGEK